jgi:hypothetical protein
MISQGINPKGFSIKTLVNSRRSSKIVQRATKALLRDSTHFHCHNNTFRLQEIKQLENFLTYRHCCKKFTQKHL